MDKHDWLNVASLVVFVVLVVLVLPTIAIIQFWPYVVGKLP